LKCRLKAFKYAQSEFLNCHLSLVSWQIKYLDTQSTLVVSNLVEPCPRIVRAPSA